MKQTKLLGIILSDDLKWANHVDYMCQRANRKIWLLRRMKILKLDENIMLDFYCKEVRSILEFGVPCWNSGLTVRQTEQIERVQKICINIILCDNDWSIPYTIGCTLLGIEPLTFRRTDLCIRPCTENSTAVLAATMIARYATRLLNLHPVKRFQ